ncbi:ATP-binding protein [Baekduia sp.]|jgi:predicted AAA+ superfamily ATPase|uniref:ATP-binding protein n=1 Tax=Baekduia sp. TaxID=2600305 RepID=UPI002E01AE5A|nr:ATP-binding protein [Baekduia sp.]
MASGLFTRHLRPHLLEALTESRAVALLGARQVGKSTLVADLATSDHPARFISLDDEATANAARADPTGFIAEISGPVVIDEIQRAPGLLLAIKQRLDSDQSRGQFLLTGSANVLTLPTVSDALPGRVEYLNLWPLSQGELHDHHETFIDELFGGHFPQVSGAPVGRSALASMLTTGGYPELQGRSARGRSRFFVSYVASIIGRDLDDIANVRNVENVERLLFMIAARSGGLASFHGMATDLGIDTNTVRAHTKILEDLFLIRRLRPWHANLGSRQIKSPKLYIVDSGLLTYLIGANERRITDDGDITGPLLESFTAMELLRQADWAQEPVQLFHYRDQQQREVDVILERHSGEIVGIEVKASATPAARDFAGLRHLRDKLGTRFKAGVVLHTGADTLPFGDRLAAVPISGLWS